MKIRLKWPRSACIMPCHTAPFMLHLQKRSYQHFLPGSYHHFYSNLLYLTFLCTFLHMLVLLHLSSSMTLPPSFLFSFLLFSSLLFSFLLLSTLPFSPLLFPSHLFSSLLFSSSVPVLAFFTSSHLFFSFTSSLLPYPSLFLSLVLHIPCTWRKSMHCTIDPVRR